MKKLWLIVGVALVVGLGCAKPFKEGLIKLGGWKLPAGRVAGYNIYMSEGRGHAFEKINDAPVVGKAIEVGNLEPGKTYWFRMTMVSKDAPPRESKPGKAWSRKAIQRVEQEKK